MVFGLRTISKKNSGQKIEIEVLTTLSEKASDGPVASTKEKIGNSKYAVFLDRRKSTAQINRLNIGCSE
ncbi:MAG: hypothetical protein IT289_11450 [Oligoflexia bacterium]|nr:hypothetical protein [Oligoflexia bacterium]